MSSEELNRGTGAFRGSDEELLSLFKGLAVPKPAMGKDELWNEIAAHIETKEQAERFSARNAMWLAAATIALIVALGVLLHREYALVVFEVPKGKMLSILLPDSSSVTINSGSTLKFRRYGFATKRTVTLSGEALFGVTKGKGNFSVTSGPNMVLVRGTVFNVKSRENLFVAECIEGEIEVVSSSQGTVKRLEAGWGLTMDSKSEAPRTFEVNRLTVASWTRGEFFYTDASLKLVLDEMERQFNIRIRCKGFDSGQRRYTGYFSAESLTEALQYVCLPMNLDFAISENGTHVEIFPAKR